MLDHVSVAVRDLKVSAGAYGHVLGALGLKRLVERPATVGFGKNYPEFWLNARAGVAPLPADGDRAGSPLLVRSGSWTTPH
jgi:catechol 2,3-dioxygenase-like lactoylglutathione lyase family enzyme